MKLLLADDHTLFRDALVQYIKRSDIEAEVSVAKDMDGVLKLMQQEPDQDLVLLDLRMPGMNGMQGFKEMQDKYPDVRVGLMSGVAEVEDVRAAMNLGAVGYFPKTLSGKALLKAIQLVLEGERFVPIDHNSSAVMPSYFADDAPPKKSDYSGMEEQQDPLSVAQGFRLTPGKKMFSCILSTAKQTRKLRKAWVCRL